MFMKYNLVLLVLFLGNELFCQQLDFKGYLGVQKNVGQDQYVFFYKNDTMNVKLPSSNRVKYTSFSWCNNDNNIICTQRVYNKKKIAISTAIVRLNFKGEIIDTLYEPNNSFGEYIYGSYLSPNDNYLLVNIRRKEKNSNVNLSGLNSPLTIRILDIKKRKVVYENINFTMSLNISFSSSPWSFDEERIVFKIRNDRKIQYDGFDVRSDVKTGIYELDFKKNTQRLILKDGYDVNCSPFENKIVYYNKKEIIVHNLTTGTSNVIFRKKASENIFGVKWYPNGKYVFVKLSKQFLGFRSTYSYRQILIDEKTKEEMTLNIMNIGSRGFIWRD